MPDAPASTSHKSNLGFLTKKIGPAPIWVYALIAVGLWYWYTHYGPGAKAAGSNASATAVDPSTGVAYAEELAAANQEIADLQGAAGTTPATSDTGGDSGSGGGGTGGGGTGSTDSGDVSPATVAEQEQDIQAQQKTLQEQEQDISQDATQDKKKPGKGKKPPPRPVTRHNRNPRQRKPPPREISGGPGRLVVPPAHHPNAPKAPADKATAPMTRWRAA